MTRNLLRGHKPSYVRRWAASIAAILIAKPENSLKERREFLPGLLRRQCNGFGSWFGLIPTLATATLNQLNAKLQQESQNLDTLQLLFEAKLTKHRYWFCASWLC